MGRTTYYIPLLLTTMLVLFQLSEISAQQKVQFTQYMFNTLVINPAYAGADEALSLTFINRNQWSGVENAPTTQTLSGHTLFKKQHLGVGLTLINDKLGVHKNLSALSSFAYHLKTGKSSYLSMGLQAGVHHKRSDYGSLAGSYNNDPKLSSAIISKAFFDVGAGFYFRSPRLHIGFSAPELIPERISINDTVSVQLSDVNYFLFSRYRFTVTENFEVEPGLLLKFLRGVPLSYDLNLNFIFLKVLTMGASYRKSESVDFLLKAQITPQLQLGYAYDHPVGEISRLSNGSHELMVQYLFRYMTKKVSSPR